MNIDFEEIRKEILKNASKEEIKEFALRALSLETVKDYLNYHYGKGTGKNENSGTIPK